MSRADNTTSLWDSNGLLIAIGCLYALIYIVFWPPINTSMDEGAYLGMAYAMRQGTVYLDEAGVSAPMSYQVGGHRVIQYPPGMSALLAVFSIGGWNAALGINLLSHLLGYAVVIAILRRLQLPGVGAVLYLLHPTAVIYSRTVMSDVTSGTLTALIFLCYLRRYWGAVGLLIGASVLIRTANGLMLPLLCIAVIAELLFLDPANRVKIVEWKKWIFPPAQIVMGCLPLLLFAYLYQRVVQGGGWSRYTSDDMFGPQHLPHVLPNYLLAMLIVFPGMVFAPLLYRREGRAGLLALCGGFLLFYSCFYFQDATGSRWESFIIGQRYLLVVMPLFVVAYVAAGYDLLKSRPIKLPIGITVGTVVVSLFLLAGAIHWKHQQRLREMTAARDTVLRVTVMFMSANSFIPV
jgi:hypothetical protein